MGWLGAKILIGVLVGVLIGLTGLGGGVLLLPILIFGLGVPPILAVGSDAAFNALTKVGAAVMHWRRGTVNWGLVLSLSAGSLPGALGGVLLLNHLRVLYGSGVNHFLRIFVGVLLVCIPILLMVEDGMERKLTLGKRSPERSRGRMVAVGLVSGFLVGVSSVGSGSVIMILFLILLAAPPAVLVGTDIMHAVILTGFAGLLQFHLGNVEMPLVLALLVGSVPGSMIGVRLGMVLPAPWLKRVLCVVLVASGARMLWV